MNVHMNANITSNSKPVDGEISLESLRRFIQYVRRLVAFYLFCLYLHSFLSMTDGNFVWFQTVVLICLPVCQSMILK